MAIEYFQCWHKYRKSISRLTDEQVGRLFRALFDFSETGKVAELDDATGVAFDIIAADIDLSKEKYFRVCERNKKNGRTGGRPKNNESPKNIKNPKNPVAFLETQDNPPLKQDKANQVKSIQGKAVAAVPAAVCAGARDVAPDGALPPLPPPADENLPDAKGKKESEKPKPDSPEEFFEQGGFGKAGPTVRAMMDKYREQGCADSLLIRAMQEALDNGVAKWAYVRPVLERCLSAGIYDADAFAAAKRPHAGRNAAVDRPAPSGNNFLQHGARRPLLIKREEGSGR